jgi:photosystem II stability/assembly factor-like uncharacterized protein
MFMSEDQGTTWKPVVSLPTTQGVKSLAGVSVFRTVDDPTDPNSFYWLSRESGMFFTLDEGGSWQQARLPVAKAFVYDVAVDPTNKCILYASLGTALLKSNDCARSWVEVYRQSSATALITAVSVDPFAPTTVVTTIDNGDVFQSLDAGETWRLLHRFDKTPFAVVRPDPVQEGIWYGASRKKGLYRSEDHGETWTELGTTMKEEFSGSLDYRRIYIHPTKGGVIYWVSAYGIIVSNDSGESWRPMNLVTPPGKAQIYGFAVNPNNDNEVYYTATINNRSTFYRSADGGETWKTQKLPSGQVPTMLRAHPGVGKGNIIYVGFNYLPKQ